MPRQPTMFINATTALEACNGSSTHFQFQPPSSFDIFTGVLMILIIITSLAGNILIVYAFLTNPKLRVVNNYFIMNLTLSDILTASMVIPFDVDMKLNGLSSWDHGAIMCKVWTTAYIISVPTSILTLCTVSIDRYQAISNPLGYRAGVTLNKTKALCLVGGIWALSLVMAFLPLTIGSPLDVTLSRDLPPDCPDVHFCYFDISPSYSAAVTIIAFILPSIAMATLYVRMYIIITYERYICDENSAGIRGNNNEVDKIGKERAKGNKRGETKTEYAKNKSNKAGINGRHRDENKQKEINYTQWNLGKMKSGSFQNDQRRLKTNKNTIVCDKAGGNKAEIHQNDQTRLKTNENTTECDKAGRNKAEIHQNGMKNQALKIQCDEKRTSQNIRDAHSSDKTGRNIAEIDREVYEKNESDETGCSKHEIHQDTSNNNGNTRINANNATAGNSIERNKREKETRCDEHRNSKSNSNNNESNRNQSHPSARNSNVHSPSHHALYQTKVARHFSVIVLVQLVCWYPYSVASLVYNLCGSCDQISSSAHYFLLTIGYMSCAINPYLYAYQQRSFRQVFGRMLGMKS